MTKTQDANFGPQRSAADWYAVLHNPGASAEDWAAFRRWIETPANRKDYRALEDALSAVDEIGNGVREEGELPQRLRAPAGRAFSRRVPLGLSLGALAAGICALAGVSLFLSPTAERGEYLTGVGEQSEIALADGSIVTMNTASSLKYEFTEGERRIFLSSGQAIFDVAADKMRPFVVIAEYGAVEATGTEFEVYARRDGMTVTLLEGAVAVAPGEGGRGLASAIAARFRGGRSDVIALAPGDQLALSANGAAGPVRRVDAERETGWRSGKIHLVDIALRDAVREMNRYARASLILESPELADLKLSGVFNPGDQEGFARSLEMLFPVRVRQAGGQWLISPAENKAGETR